MGGGLHGGAFARRLLEWYEPAARGLPWRGLRDPYAVWVSEIMLQQTRTGSVRAYFPRFLARFPTLAALAGASEREVLKAWEGLGYYGRARNLHRAARILRDAGGALPDTPAGWAALPGIGPYTAAAVSSICLGTREPVVDGNVVRVLARFLARDDDFRRPSGRAALAAWLRPAIEAAGDPGAFNQAMMDLGATLCAPRRPECDRCPLAAECRARASGEWGRYPRRPPRRPLPVREVLAFRVRDAAGRVLLRRRPSRGLLGGLWELPNVPAGPGETPAAAFARAAGGASAAEIIPAETLTRSFTHFRQIMAVHDCRGVSGLRERPGEFRFADPRRLPLTTAARRACGKPQS